MEPQSPEQKQPIEEQDEYSEFIGNNVTTYHRRYHLRIHNDPNTTSVLCIRPPQIKDFFKLTFPEPYYNEPDDEKQNVLMEGEPVMCINIGSCIFSTGTLNGVEKKLFESMGFFAGMVLDRTNIHDGDGCKLISVCTRGDFYVVNHSNHVIMDGDYLTCVEQDFIEHIKESRVRYGLLSPGRIICTFQPYIPLTMSSFEVSALFEFLDSLYEVHDRPFIVPEQMAEDRTIKPEDIYDSATIAARTSGAARAFFQLSVNSMLVAFPELKDIKIENEVLDAYFDYKGKKPLRKKPEKRLFYDSALKSDDIHEANIGNGCNVLEMNQQMTLNRKFYFDIMNLWLQNVVHHTFVPYDFMTPANAQTVFGENSVFMKFLRGFPFVPSEAIDSDIGCALQPNVEKLSVPGPNEKSTRYKYNIAPYNRSIPKKIVAVALSSAKPGQSYRVYVF